MVKRRATHVRHRWKGRRGTVRRQRGGAGYEELKAVIDKLTPGMKYKEIPKLLERLSGAEINKLASLYHNKEPHIEKAILEYPSSDVVFMPMILNEFDIYKYLAEGYILSPYTLFTMYHLRCLYDPTTNKRVYFSLNDSDDYLFVGPDNNVYVSIMVFYSTNNNTDIVKPILFTDWMLSTFGTLDMPTGSLSDVTEGGLTRPDKWRRYASVIKRGFEMIKEINEKKEIKDRISRLEKFVKDGHSPLKPLWTANAKERARTAARTKGIPVSANLIHMPNRVGNPPILPNDNWNAPPAIPLTASMVPSAGAGAPS